MAQDDSGRAGSPDLTTPSGAGQWHSIRGSQVATVPPTASRGQQRAVCIVACLSLCPRRAHQLGWPSGQAGRPRAVRTEGPFLVGGATCGGQTQACKGHHGEGSPSEGLPQVPCKASGCCSFTPRGFQRVGALPAAGEERAWPGERWSSWLSGRRPEGLGFRLWAPLCSFSALR